MVLSSKHQESEMTAAQQFRTARDRLMAEARRARQGTKLRGRKVNAARMYNKCLLDVLRK